MVKSRGGTFVISAQEGYGRVAGIMCWDEVGLAVMVLQWCLRTAVKSLASACASRVALPFINVS